MECRPNHAKIGHGRHRLLCMTGGVTQVLIFESDTRSVVGLDYN